MGRDRLTDRLYACYLAEPGALPSSPADLAPRAAGLRRLLRDHLPPDRNASIVDLGCGHGALLYFAREAGYRRLAGIDRAASQVAAARRLGLDCVREGDAFDALAGMRDASVDVVVCFDMLEHLDSDELLRLVDEIHRVLVPGGRCLVHVPNGQSPFGGVDRYGDLTHCRAFTPAAMAQLAAACGFAAVHCFEDPPAVKGVASAVRRALWSVLRLVYCVALAIERGRLDLNAIVTMNLLAVLRR